jgi:outer membrane PBP1 activator LpoA protein
MSLGARAIGPLLILAITCGCARQGNVVDAPTGPPPDPLASAHQALARGDYAAAGAAYAARAGEVDLAAAQRLQGLAALALADAGAVAEADAMAASLVASDDARAQLAIAAADARAGKEAAALARARQVSAQGLTPYEQGAQARLVARAAQATRAFALAAEAAISALSLPYPADQQAPLMNIAWSALESLAPAVLSAAAVDPSPTRAGWYALALDAREAGFDPGAFAARVAAWLGRFPGHPAAPLIAELEERAQRAATRPRRVAVILPFGGALAAAAQAVRDGFLTAWYADAPNTRPAVTFYAGAAQDSRADYTRAVADGADFVVGPLEKSLVEQLRGLTARPAPILALNVIDALGGGEQPADFYQFGLTPEDEAAQVARQAFSEEGRALLLGPESPLGARVLGSYARTWTELGGSVLGQITYGDSAEAYARAIRHALNLDLSETRAQNLRRRLGLPLEAIARRRADISVILLAASSTEGRQLLPQLRYFDAADIPIYATSHVYAGQIDPARDLDLDGLVFGDMPWLFGARDRASLDFVWRAWPQQANAYARLYAFGIDAYRVMPYLAQMRARPSMRVPGLTGDLHMDGDGVLHRTLMWLRIVQGVPRALATLDAPP